MVAVGAEYVDCADQVVGKEEVKTFTGHTKALCRVYTDCHSGSSWLWSWVDVGLRPESGLIRSYVSDSRLEHSAHCHPADITTVDVEGCAGCFAWGV